MKKHLASSLEKLDKMMQSIKEATQATPEQIQLLKSRISEEEFPADAISKAWVHWLSPNKDGNGFQMGITFEVRGEGGKRVRYVWEDIVINFADLVTEKQEVKEQVGFTPQRRGAEQGWKGKGIRSEVLLKCPCGAQFYANPKVLPKIKDLGCPACGAKTLVAVMPK